MILIFMYLRFSGVILVVLLSYYLGFAMEMEDNTWNPKLLSYYLGFRVNPNIYITYAVSLKGC